jgi:amino acid adenylation domain-containing protein
LSISHVPPTSALAGNHDLQIADETLPVRFERMAATHPSRIALGSSGWQPTYAELNAAANRLAHALLGRGGKQGDRVAILMRHDTPVIAAMLAALKAGRIVVVLNASDPVARLMELVEEAQAQLVVTDGVTPDLPTATGRFHILNFDPIAADGPTHNPALPLSPDDVAYVGYTSGSTGRPKGVIWSHRTVLHHVRRLSTAMGLVAEDRIALLASVSGGQGPGTAWCALANGATLCPFPVIEQGVVGLARWMQDQRITIYASSASLFRHFMRTLDDGAVFPHMRAVRIASEPATSADFAAFQSHFSERCGFFHTMSSSETLNITVLRLSRSDVVAEGRLPVGRASEGIEVLLVDEQGREVSRGEAGEIVVRSRYLSPGYWRNDTLTAERFSEHPDGNGLRLFHTGDFGRLNHDGLLEFVGRKDDRLKLRGYRIELAEVEDALLCQPGVERVALSAVERPNAEPQLVAYVVMRSGQSSSAATLRRALRAILPRHMVPSAFVFLHAFPLTPHGKINRGKLRELHPVLRPLSSEELPRSETETLLAEMWSKAFDLPRIGRTDDFFDLGGDSLIAAVVGALIHAALGVELNLDMFAEHSTLAELAAAVDKMRQEGNAEAAPPLVRVARDQPLPLSLFQERAWRESQTPEGLAGYSHVYGHRLLGPLDREALSESINELARRHESLRTTFAEMDGQPVQVIHPPAPVPLPFIDLADMADPEKQARHLLKEQAKRVFDLSKGPLSSFLLVRLHAHEHWFLRAIHHIIHDAWSWEEVYVRELTLLYEAKLRRDVPPLPEVEPLQYADYAVWQRKVLHVGGRAHQEAMAWWVDALAGSPRVLELPFRRTILIRRTRLRAAVDPAQGIIPWGLDPETSRRLDECAHAEGATYYMIRLAAFVAVLAGVTGETDVVLGTYLTNRNRLALQNIFGFFVNLATLRIHCDPSMTFRTLLSLVRKRVAETEAHGAIPYDEVRKELTARGTPPPEIQVIFHVSRHGGAVRLGDLRLVRLREQFSGMPWGLSMNLDEYSEDRNCRVTFDAGLYQPKGVRKLIDGYRRFLDAASRRPDLPIATLLRASDLRWRRKRSSTGFLYRLLRRVRRHASQAADMAALRR